MAARVGFEPTDGLSPPTVFKTAAVPIMLNPPYVVELSGLEPLTPCVQSKCSPY